MISQTDEESLKAQLKALADRIRYSDPISASALSSIEEQITQKIQSLKAALADIQTAQNMIEDIQMLLEERNKKCKLNK